MASLTTERVSFNFGASLRLKKGWEFDAVFRMGRQYKGDLVRLYCLRGKEGPSRFGVVVGKRIANAALRSRGRRILRESLRHLAPWVEDGAWFVASLRETALRADAVSVCCDMVRLFVRAGFLKEDWGGPNWQVDRFCRESRERLSR